MGMTFQSDLTGEELIRVLQAEFGATPTTREEASKHTHSNLEDEGEVPKFYNREEFHQFIAKNSRYVPVVIVPTVGGEKAYLAFSDHYWKIIHIDHTDLRYFLMGRLMGMQFFSQGGESYYKSLRRYLVESRL